MFGYGILSNFPSDELETPIRTVSRGNLTNGRLPLPSMTTASELLPDVAESDDRKELWLAAKVGKSKVMLSLSAGCRRRAGVRACCRRAPRRRSCAAKYACPAAAGMPALAGHCTRAGEWHACLHS